VALRHVEHTGAPHRLEHRCLHRHSLPDGDNRVLTQTLAHLHPTADLAPRALLPGDPGRALALAQELLAAPLMFNHNRGLWGYSGAYTGDGEPLTIQATGLGGPSAAIVLEELAALGLERAIRVGTATALDATLDPGDLLIVERALCGDGTSAALGALGEVEADPALLAELRRGASVAGSSGERVLTSGTVVSSDLFYESATERIEGWRERGALALELPSAALFALGARRGVALAAVVAISGPLPDGGQIEATTLLEASLAAGRLAASALSP
jgi:uridine phosphorylase